MLFLRHGQLRRPHLYRAAACVASARSGACRAPSRSVALLSHSRTSSGRCLWRCDGRRTLFSSAAAGILTPPAVFAGLILTLWFYKCCMMILFQNKIIYMPSIPPFSRSETISDYENICAPIEWRQEMIRSLDGTKIALAVGSWDPFSAATRNKRPAQDVVILYFQGNASSLPPRLPLLSEVMKAARATATPLACTIVALSYRGFWTSSGSASQPGIEKDAAAALAWVQQLQTAMPEDVPLVLWGQSIGAGVAAQAVANYLRQQEAQQRRVDALVLETPFRSIRDMLVAMYPQKWLPYRYLWPFLRNWWDNKAALTEIRERGGPSKVLVLTAEKDEVVPPEQGRQLVGICREAGFDVTHCEVRGALHHEATSKNEGRLALVKFLSTLRQKS